MSPNIAAILKDIPFSPVKHVWFDLLEEISLKTKMDDWMEGKSLKDIIPSDFPKDIPMPFDNLALLLPIGLRMNSGDIRPEKFVATFERTGDSLKVCFWLKNYSKAIAEITVTQRLFDEPTAMEVNPNFVRNAENTKFKAKDRLTSLVKFTVPVFSAVCYSTPDKLFISEGYKCVPNASNANRIKRGKRPLFEWETVLIKPVVREVGDSHGGTHASPKPHDRRGHQRRYKNGKVVYVRPCTINKHRIKEEGFIHHDYKIVN